MKALIAATIILVTLLVVLGNVFSDAETFTNEVLKKKQTERQVVIENLIKRM
jgi:hypothetical protein